MLQRRSPSQSPKIHAFSTVEMLVVLGIISLLLAVLIPTIAGLTSTWLQTQSMANMKQVGSYLVAYAGDNRDTIVPSSFDYRGLSDPGKVRSTAVVGEKHTGSWTDILWTVNELGQYYSGLTPQDISASPTPDASGPVNPYLYDSPDKQFYGFYDESIANPFRSAAQNTRNADPNAIVSPDGVPTPFGTGAFEITEPGYFAANDFFAYHWDPSEGKPLYTHGQIKHPTQAMYLVDSFYGETIAPECDPFDNRPNAQGVTENIQVDFRYKGTSLMLFLDGRVAPTEPWETLDTLEQSFQFRIRQPTSLRLPDVLCDP